MNGESSAVDNGASVPDRTIGELVQTAVDEMTGAQRRAIAKAIFPHIFALCTVRAAQLNNRRDEVEKLKQKIEQLHQEIAKLQRLTAIRIYKVACCSFALLAIVLWLMKVW